jgi:hypothetical protein
MADPDEPRDPDLDAVPMAAEALDNLVVSSVGPDGEREAPALFCLTAGSIASYGDARRAREDDEQA